MISTSSSLSGRKCQGPDCKKSASFDVFGGKGIYCLAHREPGMVNVTNKKCEFLGCVTAACFDVSGGNGRYEKKRCIYQSTRYFSNKNYNNADFAINIRRRTWLM